MLLGAAGASLKKDFSSSGKNQTEKPQEAELRGAARRDGRRWCVRAAQRQQREGLGRQKPTGSRRSVKRGQSTHNQPACLWQPAWQVCKINGSYRR